MTLKNLKDILRKHKTLVAITFLVVVAVVAGVTFLMPPVYEAKSSLLVKLSKDDTVRPEVGSTGPRFVLNLSQDELINTELQILRDRALAERVIRSFGLARMYPGLVGESVSPMEAAIVLFEKNLELTGVRKSNVIWVSFKHSDPEIAAGAVNLLVEAFKEKHLAVHSDPHSSFLGSQMVIFEKKLTESEQELQALQRKDKAFSLEEHRSLLLKQRTELDTAYKMTHNSINEVKEKSASIEQQMKSISGNDSRYTQTERDKIIVEVKLKLLALRLKEDELLKKYTPQNRLVVMVQNEIVKVQAFLKEQEVDIARKVKSSNPVYQDMEKELFRSVADLNANLAKANSIRTQLTQLDKEIASLDLSQNKVQSLKRQVALNEKNFKSYAERHEESRIADTMNKLNLSNISVIQTAAVPVEPIVPNKKINLAVGVLFGVAAGIGIALIKEHRSRALTRVKGTTKSLLER